MESLRSRKKGRKLEVTRSRQKSKKSKRERSPCVSSSESADSSISNHRASLRRRSRGRDPRRKRGRSRSRSTDSSDQHSRKRKRQPSTNRAGTEKKKKTSKKRHKEHPIKRRAREIKQRYRRSISISCSCSCSDSSCRYSSKSCSTCSSSHSNSDGSSRERRQSTRSKRRSNDWGYSKEIKKRDGMKGKEKKGYPNKKGADELGFRNPNGKKVHECNGKVSSSSKVVHSPERVKTRKRNRNHLEESHSLSIPVENKTKVSRKYSNMDASQSGKSVSCNAECSVEEHVDESKAEDLELLLRQKALENLRKFRGCQFGKAEVLSFNKFKQPVCLDSREPVQAVSYGRSEGTRANETSEFERELKESLVTDRVLNGHHVDTRRERQQHIEASSSQRENNTFKSDMDLVRIQPSGARETCTSPVPYSQIPPVSEFHTDCDANTASLVSEVYPSKPDTSETISAHNDDNKPEKVADKDSDVVGLNKHRTWKTEVTELEEPSVKVLQDCTLEKEIVSYNSTSDTLQVCTLENKNSQTKMVKADRATAESSKGDTSPTEMPKLDDFTTSSKNQNSQTEMIKDVEGTGESSKEGASQTAIKESVDSTFQQKTMSVMRGGEMVQVSYKVYIPQRAATLAKRQLKR